MQFKSIERDGVLIAQSVTPGATLQTKVFDFHPPFQVPGAWIYTRFKVTLTRTVGASGIGLGSFVCEWGYKAQSQQSYGPDPSWPHQLTLSAGAADVMTFVMFTANIYCVGANQISNGAIPLPPVLQGNLSEEFFLAVDGAHLKASGNVEAC